MLSPAQDKQLDRLNDQGFSYTQAYERLDLTPPELSPLSVDAIKARKAANEYYTDEFNLTGNRIITEEQAEINRIGAAACRAAINDARKTQQ